MKPLLISLSIALLSVLAGSLAAQSAEEKGLAIVQEVDRRDTGFGDFQVSMRMLLRNKQGEESLRHMRSRTMEVADDGDRSMIIFDRPRDVEGTALLTYTHKTEADDQWLYLPALKRVKRIASRNKSGPFMGSEFAYEDLSSQEIEKYTYRYIEDTELDGVPMFLIERDPVDKYSGYKRQLVWINKDEYRAEKIEFYDRKDSLLKTLRLRGYQKYLDQYWRADEMYMENHQTGKTTLLTWEDYQFGNGYTEADFKKNALKRAR
jgi:hypothetical protein